MNQIFLTDLPDQYDRLLAVAGGKLSDTAFELVGIVFAFFKIPSFQIFGAVETKTETRGFILGQTRTISHWLSGGAKKTLIHSSGMQTFLLFEQLLCSDPKSQRMETKKSGSGNLFPSVDEEEKIFLKNPWE
ncbi:hypothetical protein [Leptospira alexanderi]|uniref:hypothetical protein n=1 Tax=Leptospira alexanderi TaxID=100053 RepID=UPI001FD62559|nr:hypothetical protein [Leptospira alexanderi]